MRYAGDFAIGSRWNVDWNSGFKGHVAEQTIYIMILSSVGPQHEQQQQQHAAAASVAS